MIFVPYVYSYHQNMPPSPSPPWVMKNNLNSVHTAPEIFQNAALFLRLGSASRLIRGENGAFRKRSSNLKTPGFRYRMGGKCFENGVFFENDDVKINHRRLLLFQIDQFRYIKIQPKTIDLITRLWGINTQFVGFIP